MIEMHCFFKTCVWFCLMKKDTYAFPNPNGESLKRFNDISTYVSYEFLKNLTASHSWLDTCACKYSLGISLKNPYPTIKKAVYRTWILWSFKWVYYVKHYTFNVLANSISFNNILRSLSCAYQPNAACRLNPGL